MAAPPSAPGPRGILQPQPPAIEALKCEACGGWFLPEPTAFGCPWCAEAEEVQRLIPGPL